MTAGTTQMGSAAPSLEAATSCASVAPAGAAALVVGTASALLEAVGMAVGVVAEGVALAEWCLPPCPPALVGASDGLAARLADGPADVVPVGVRGADGDVGRALGDDVGP